MYVFKGSIIKMHNSNGAYIRENSFLFGKTYVHFYIYICISNNLTGLADLRLAVIDDNFPASYICCKIQFKQDPV